MATGASSAPTSATQQRSLRASAPSPSPADRVSASLASATRLRSRWAASLIATATARLMARNGVRGGITSRGSPCRTHASRSGSGRASCIGGVTPKPSALTPAASSRCT
ncbi:hypothetical protein A8924_5974 [Saccharopolyspora erythraea NRRL 2338]|nr:hypothetical protein N599_16025 [Saccharopolyspora erythraea D]PFG98460.1 hypothetical protein A8924_5974 [Saccharopolyspora erythraea NRRL 2338]